MAEEVISLFSHCIFYPFSLSKFHIYFYKSLHSFFLAYCRFSRQLSTDKNYAQNTLLRLQLGIKCNLSAINVRIKCYLVHHFTQISTTVYPRVFLSGQVAHSQQLSEVRVQWQKINSTAKSLHNFSKALFYRMTHQSITLRQQIFHRLIAFLLPDLQTESSSIASQQSGLIEEDFSRLPRAYGTLDE